MPKKINTQVGKGIGYIDKFNGTLNINLKEDFTPTVEWAKEKIDLSLKSIGNRYITYNNNEYKGLNIRIDLSNLFESISNTNEFKYNLFLEKLKVESKFENAWQYIYHNRGVKYHHDLYKDNKKYEWKDKEAFFKYLLTNNTLNEQETIITVYSNLSSLIELMLSFYLKYKDLLDQFTDIKLLKKNFFSIKNRELIQYLDILVDKILAHSDSKLVDKYLNMFSPYPVEKIGKILKRIKNIKVYIFEFKKMIYEKSYKELPNLNPNNDLSTYLFKYSLISGEAMCGKTHMLSDIAKKRIDDNKPTILIYAQKFEGNDRPIQQIIKQLHLEQYQYTDEEFLEVINAWGKKNNELVFLIIDAINETPEKSVWRNNFIEFVSMVKKYPYIALIMSIRDIEKRVVFTRDIENYIKADMIEIEHPGFKEIEYTVLKKFCEVFDVNLPKFPLTSPVFANPGLMFLFFETLKRNNIKEISEQVLKPNFIIEEYIKDRNRHFKEIYQIDDRRTFIHKGTNVIANKIVLSNFIENVKYDEILNDIKDIHTNLLEYLISEGILLEELGNLDEVYLYFSYQKFGNYFIALYLLSDFEKSKEIILNLLKNYTTHQALVEALIIRYSETERKDFIDIFPELFKNEALNSIRYKCFLQSLKLPHNIENKIENKTENFINLDLSEKQKILDLLLHFSYEKSSNYNMQNFLHNVLLSLSMAERDYHWSIYLHYSFTDNGIVKHIINWAWNKEADYFLEDESLHLYGLTLGWFLTSSNRELRDGTTKALVNLFTDRVDVFLSVLSSFETVNDLYVLERFYAVGYGIVLRSSNHNGFRELGEYIYGAIFDKDIVVEHILLRDYAKLTVETIDWNIGLGIDMSKVLPPYGSSMPSNYPNYEEIENYRAFSSIIRSMRTERLMPYGDFGRYTFQSSLTTFDYKKFDGFDIQDLSNYAVKVIRDEYVEDIELFHKTEEMMRGISYERHIHKVERVGKKYQWLAMYKILAKVADNYQVSKNFRRDNYIDYKDTSHLYIRNIDPTTILKEKIKTDKPCWYTIDNSEFENIELKDNEAWLKSKEKLPSLKEIVNPNIKDEYLILDLFFTKAGNKESEQYRYLMYDIHSYIVKQEEFDDIVIWAREHNFYQESIEDDGENFDEDYIRAYPNSIDDDYRVNSTRHRIYSQLQKKIPCEMLKTSVSYLNEGKSYDSSVSDYINIALPAKWLINQMKLRQSLVDGEWINENNEIVFFDPTVNICSGISNEGVLVANKKLLLNWLEENGYVILWILNGEKDLQNSDSDKFDDIPFIGYGGVSGYAYFDGDEFVEDIDVKIDRPIG